MDKKARFKLILEGKLDCGYLEFWSISEGDLAGIYEGESPSTASYVVGARYGKFEIIDDYAVSATAFYTLGEQVTHSKLVDIVGGKVEGKYYDPEFATYKVSGWPD